MKTIVDDPEGFFESGGWSFLDPESDGDDDDDDDSEEDENFEVSGSDEASDYSDSDEDFSEDSNISDEENYSEELDSDESSGKDWSDLEAEAAEDDKNRRDSFCSVAIIFSFLFIGAQRRFEKKCNVSFLFLSMIKNNVLPPRHVSTVSLKFLSSPGIENWLFVVFTKIY
jgi:hypothetical protein